MWRWPRPVSAGRLGRYEKDQSACAEPIADVLDTGWACKLGVRRGLEQPFFHKQVTQSTRLLLDMKARHRHQLKARAPGLGARRMRLVKQQLLRPRRQQIPGIWEDYSKSDNGWRSFKI